MQPPTLTTLTTLEFSRIQEELANYAACQLGKELALRTQPLPSLAQVRQVQDETTEARALLGGGRSMPFGGIQDVRLLVERALQGGVLRPEQLTAVAETAYGCRQLHRFLTDHRAQAPLLARRAETFGRFEALEEEIHRCIERGGVSSRASRSLKQVRGEIATLENRIRERAEGLLRQYREHLQEPLVTIRNGRYVIPVKASARAAVPGTVHGASASGSTVYVEPRVISQMAEELEVWRAIEEAEVEQVLIALSGHVAAHGHSLLATLRAVAELDYISARARLSQAWDARPVHWNEEGLVDLKDARHPLLGRGAIGNRIRMSRHQRMLIVTGPNTGGKTLLLKTLGLLVLLAQSGLHIPVAAGSTLCFFADVFADVGDHQSLEQSLSTFSGHIANVAPMLAQAGPETLILLDELGSGTDPHEGTGLGIALLEAFLNRGAYVLVTTHLRELKEFGRATPGCSIAGMGFDGETLQPTYQLIYGTLGESHGLEIAERAGLPSAVVQRARELVYGGGGAAGATTPAPARAVAEVPPALPQAVPPAAPRVAHPASGPALDPEEVAPSAPSPAPVLTIPAPGRVRIWHEGAGQELPVRESARRHYPEGLVPGDRVWVREGHVVEVAQRQTVLVSRDADTMVESVVAANLSQMLIVTSARHPDFHPTVLARHLLYAERQGLRPIICLTKGDLVPPGVSREWLKPFRKAGYPALVVSATRQQGLAELARTLAGEMTGVMGYPGAGKSVLLAALLGQEPQEPHGLGAGGPVRSRYRRDAEPALWLYPLRVGGWLMDLPGLRQLGVWKPDLGGGFREFSPFASGCHRPDCLHRDEPGCAIREAAQEGRLPRHRYEQYRLLLGYLGLG